MNELELLLNDLAVIQGEIAAMYAIRKSVNCGANATGGGGFQPGNTCGKDGGGGEAMKINPDEFDSEVLDEVTKWFNDSSKSQVVFGVRVMSETPDGKSEFDLSPGSPVENSYQWDDGEPTDDELDGVSTIGVFDGNRNYDGPSKDGIKGLLKKIRPYMLNGQIVALIAGENWSSGLDRGEWIISDPVVVKGWMVDELDFEKAGGVSLF